MTQPALSQISSGSALLPPIPEISSSRAEPEGSAAPPLIHRTYLAGGEIIEWTGKQEQVISPICREQDGELKQVILGSVPALTSEQALAALDSAVAAYGNGRGLWPSLGCEERIRCVEKFAASLAEKREELIELIMWEVAKTKSDAAKEVDRTLEYIQETIAALRCSELRSEELLAGEGIIGKQKRQPLGVCLCMGPYNYPLNETLGVLIPALLMGNTAVLKPPRLGVLMFGALQEAFRDAFPPGVVNIIYGDGREIITPIMKSGKVDVLAFIGSNGAAEAILANHPKRTRLREVLGLGAKNAAIILPDADLERAVQECVKGALSYNGQRCTDLKLLFVHRDIAEKFSAMLSEEVSRLKLGMPWDDGVQITPIPDLKAINYFNELIQDAGAHGARVINPGGGQTQGTLFRPAVVYPVDSKMRLYSEEQFGPVVPIVPFDTIEEPLSFYEQTNLGQQVSIFGRDPAALLELALPLSRLACRVN
ncbi:MAG: NADP-dependent glyceraldehyde-3-phosphate dehydrogenase, partial [Proteobacteria bacterium]